MRAISICQDINKLLTLRHFDFDLTDIGFVSYYESRTGDLVSRNSSGSLCNADEWRETCRWIVYPKDIVYRIRRAKLQDCWEIYCAYEMPALRQEAA